MTLTLDAAVAGRPLALAPGPAHLLCGRSGAGKTRLLRRIAGLVRGPGLILLDDRPLDRQAPAARRIGWLPAAAQPADPAGREQRLDRLLEARPRLLLLDDPLTGLGLLEQRQWAARLAERLAALADRCIVLVASRDAGLAPVLAARSIVLDQGRVLAEGRGVDLVTDPPDLAIAAITCDGLLSVVPARLQRHALVLVDGPRVALMAPLPVTDPAAELSVGLLADDLRSDGHGGDLAIDAVVTRIDFDGECSRIDLQARCGLLRMRRSGLARWAIGERIRVHVDPGALLVFDPAGRRIQASERTADRAANRAADCAADCAADRSPDRAAAPPPGAPD